VSKSKTSLAQLTSLTINFCYGIDKLGAMLIGVDPGTVNLGIALLDVPTASGEVYQATLHQIKFAQRAINTMGRLKAVQEVLNELHLPKFKKSVIIEGASYGDKYRQVELEDVRASALMWFDKHNSVCQVVAPNTIRKNAFGSAKVKAHEYWDCLKLYPDAAAALSCAVCCLS
jgi:Holliday junction resolvasome RuvABC endonuclease subunit